MRTNRNGQYMPRARNVVLSIALIAAVFTGYLLVKRNDSPVRDQGGETADQAATRENVADPRKPFAQMYANGEAPDSAVRPQDDGTDCISPAQLESDPVLTAEYASARAAARLLHLRCPLRRHDVHRMCEYLRRMEDRRYDC